MPAVIAATVLSHDCHLIRRTTWGGGPLRYAIGKGVGMIPAKNQKMAERPKATAWAIKRHFMKRPPLAATSRCIVQLDGHADPVLRGTWHQQLVKRIVERLEHL
jgi:hypothetical protein